jgi:hypothetical protein
MLCVPCRSAHLWSRIRAAEQDLLRRRDDRLRVAGLPVTAPAMTVNRVCGSGDSAPMLQWNVPILTAVDYQDRDSDSGEGRSSITWRRPENRGLGGQPLSQQQFLPIAL